jgi:beta-N-acetylhexosaminidase
MKLAIEALRKGITIIKNGGNILPLSKEANHKVLVVYPKGSYLTLVEEERYAENELGEIVRETHPTATVIKTSNEPTEQELELIIEKADEYETIIIGTLSALKSKAQTELLTKLVRTGKCVILLAMRNPYDLAISSQVHASVCTYEFTPGALRMAVKAIYGEEIVTGSMPITIPELDL